MKLWDNGRMQGSASSGGQVGRGQVSAVGLAVAMLLGTVAPGPVLAARGSWVGAAVEPSPGGAGGLKVNRVSYQGPAARAGVKPGDVVTALDGRLVSAPLSARSTVVAWRRGSVHRLTLRRGARSWVVTVRSARRPRSPGYLRLYLVHAPLPDFTLPRAMAPGNVTLSKLRGKVVLVLFWASWCGVCKTLLPLVSKLHRRFGSRDLAVVGVSRDAKLSSLRRAVQKHRLPFLVAHDRRNRVGKKNRIMVIPSLLMLDRRGVVRSYVQGAGYSYAQVRRVVRRMLRRRRPRPSRVRNERELWL